MKPIGLLSPFALVMLSIVVSTSTPAKGVTRPDAPCIECQTGKYPYAIVSRNGLSVTGSLAAEEIPCLQKSLGERIILKKEGRWFMIKDRPTIQSVRTANAKVESVDRRQAELGREQTRLTQRQIDLQKKQADLELQESELGAGYDEFSDPPGDDTQVTIKIVKTSPSNVAERKLEDLDEQKDKVGDLIDEICSKIQAIMGEQFELAKEKVHATESVQIKVDKIIQEAIDKGLTFAFELCEPPVIVTDNPSEQPILFEQLP